MPAADGAFVPLAQVLRQSPAVACERPAQSAAASPPAGPPAGSEIDGDPQERVNDGRFSALAASSVTVGTPADALSEMRAARDARLFAAALADAFDLLLARLVEALAADVLGRELLLAPADVSALARRLIADYAADGPVRLRVSPDDAEIACALPVIVDVTLVPGDAVLECRAGDIDARLEVRLAAVSAQVLP